MSESIENGGPAFPCAGHENGTEFDRGISMRDYFAAKAMQGILSHDEWADIDHMAEYSYKLADAMLNARSKS